jgi:alpha-tubulin suppressor-like RCC1 family protein
MTRRTRLTLCLAGAVLIGVSCRDDSNVGPTDSGGPEAEPALVTTTTAPLAFAQVSAGGMHTCGVATDHRAYCWGWSRTTPTLVTGGLRFTQINAGTYTACGVTTTGRAYCWGSSLSPMAVPGGHLFRQVSTGVSHTCGVTTDDRAYCWGDNVWGQLGNGTSDPSGNSHPMPVAVAGGLRFREVSTGSYHSCGVTTTDRAYCWGGDRFGEIGDGSAHGNCMFSGGQLPCRKSPTLVAGGYRFRQVDAGGGLGPGEGGEGGTDGGRTCGVTTDNKAFCWGDGSHGQLGNGTRSIAFSPRRVSGGLSFRSVSAGLNPSCGVTTSSLAYCWGDGTWGLGDGTTTDRLTPAAVGGGHSFRQVSAGGYHICGTTPGSVAYCWGNNGEGELGDGTNNTRLKPRAVVGPM